MQKRKQKLGKGGKRKQWEKVAMPGRSIRYCGGTPHAIRCWEITSKQDAATKCPGNGHLDETRSTSRTLVELVAIAALVALVELVELVHLCDAIHTPADIPQIRKWASGIIWDLGNELQYLSAPLSAKPPANQDLCILNPDPWWKLNLN